MRYCYYLFLLPALLGACRKDPVPDGLADDTPPTPVVDSTVTTLRLETGGRELRSLDLFVYDAAGIRALEAHTHPGGKGLSRDTVRVRVPEGEKIYVAIANSPRRLNLKALSQFDAMSQLTFSFSDDDPACPILGGICTTAERSGTVELQPLLCRVVLASVSNTMESLDLLENPRVRLRDLPDGAEILRQRDFRPTELLDAGPWAELPCDVGFYPQEPGIVLWCYPNDTPENILGVPRPTLEFVCEIRGETCTFPIQLPPLSRGAGVEVELSVDDPDSFRYRIR